MLRTSASIGAFCFFSLSIDPSVMLQDLLGEHNRVSVAIPQHMHYTTEAINLKRIFLIISRDKYWAQGKVS